MENTLQQFIEDTEHVIKIVAFAVDSDALAVMVDIGDVNSHTIPHITIALRNGVQASYSSILITNTLADGMLLSVEPPINIKGVTRRVVL